MREGLHSGPPTHAPVPVVTHRLERFMVGESLADTEPVGLLQAGIEEEPVNAWADAPEISDPRLANAVMWDASIRDAFAVGGLTLSGVGEGSGTTSLGNAARTPGAPPVDTPKVRIVHAAE